MLVFNIILASAIAGTVIGVKERFKDLNRLEDNQALAADASFTTACRTDARIDSIITSQVTPDYADLQANSVRVDIGGGCGTGVMVTRKVYNVTRTYVWTAGHVVVHLRKPDGSFKNASIYQEQRKDGLLVGTTAIDAKVIAYSAPEEEDLALLEILQDNFQTDGARFLLDTDPLKVGTKLVHVGCTLGLYNSVSHGIISQTDRNLMRTGKMFDQTSCMGYPGSSGGGVYLESGECVGLLTRGAGAGLNFIVPVRRMMDWAKKIGIEWALDPSIPVPLTRAENQLEIVEAPVEIVEPMPDGGPSMAPKRITIIPFGK